jgi:dCTP deaminase
MSDLSKSMIEEHMCYPLEERLVITPLLNRKKQITDGAVDVRLGTEFIIIKRTSMLGLESKEASPAKIKKNIRDYQERVKIRIREEFILHPNQLVLGSTLEYISIPNNLSAYVLTRSSWGRLGLIIATATYVNAGFKGCLTLELENLGEVPIALYPGTRIAQLVLNKLEGKGKYKDRSYMYPTGPEFSKAYEDDELDIWRKSISEEA